MGFVIAKRDTYINLMRNMDSETKVAEGTKMFHITNDKQTRYLNYDEICIYTPDLGLNYGYIGDWEIEKAN